MKRIVLPTDFSKNAWNAIAYALSIFKGVECEFFIVNAYQVGSSGLATKMGRANDTRLYRLMKEQSERELNRVLEKVKETDNNPKHSFNTLSIVDNLVNAVGKTVYNKEIDYIVMGTKGASGLKEVFMGSNTYKIINEIDFCPIIAVPDEFQVKDSIDTIVLATGYEHLFETYELNPLFKLAKLFDSEIWVTYAGDPTELTPQQLASKKVMEKKLKSIKHKFVEVEKGSSIYSAIQKTIVENEEVDMVAMINYGHGFFEKLTHEAVIKKISFNTQVPFLVMHLFE
ncbi:universal stress protein [Muricauda sp. MAR_2010_75]|jgi:nucleotide-binding universal stress UspA family protein|uniref:universal stress protein n=1 Tax=Allomuricauda sp. MAR_2010_75 TaxID=1250232 RepID=UPI000567F94C|nr:universal stress protein [Muricauda sp. MAR_2010_75]